MLLSDLIEKDEFIFCTKPECWSLDIQKVTSDSRCIAKNSAFVAIRGLYHDGGAYIDSAVSLGAVAVICEKMPLVVSVPCIVVNDARKVLALMLYRFYGRAADKVKILAVTGTNGKTSTCSFLREILLRSGRNVALVGTLKSYINRRTLVLCDEDNEKMSTMTTPDPEQLYKIIDEVVSCGCEYLILEASSHALKLDKLYPLRFESSAFTNFSSEHLDFHKDLADYALSKCKIFPKSSRVFVNADDNVAMMSGDLFGDKVRSFGLYNQNSTYRALEIKNYGIDGMSYILDSPKVTFSVRCRVSGMFSVYNSMCAAAIAYESGVHPIVITDAIKSTAEVSGRLEKIKLPPKYSDISVFIDYAHTEGALRNLLITVCNFRSAGQRIVTLFGCGGERDKTKRAPMARIASYYSDLVIITEDNSRSEDPDEIIDDIMLGIDKSKPHKIIKDRKKAIEYAIKNAMSGDIILLVGKGHEQYEITKNGKVPFSEREIVYGCLDVSKMEEEK